MAHIPLIRRGPWKTGKILFSGIFPGQFYSQKLGKKRIFILSPSLLPYVSMNRIDTFNTSFSMWAFCVHFKWSPFVAKKVFSLPVWPRFQKRGGNSFWSSILWEQFFRVRRRCCYFLQCWGAQYWFLLLLIWIIWTW